MYIQQGISMGVTEAGGNKPDPIRQKALAEAQRLDVSDGKKNDWIGPSVWTKYANENGYDKKPRGLSVSAAADIIEERMRLMDSLNSFNAATAYELEEFEIKTNDEPEAEVLKPKQIIAADTSKPKEDVSVKHKAVDFNKLLNVKEKLTYDQVKEKINSTNDENLLRTIAAYLGVNIRYSNSDSTVSIGMIKQFINQHIDLLKKADKNEDFNISDSELSEYQRNNGWVSVRDTHGSTNGTTKLYEILGMTDGKYNNEQGSIGDCWLLGVGQSLTSDKELYNRVFQKDDQGVTITFYGVKDKQGKPCRVRVTNEQIQRVHASNISMQNNGSGEWGSNDPDAIALEIAMPDAIRQWNSNMDKVLKYMKYSSSEHTVKPDVSKMSNPMSYDDYWELSQYLSMAERYNEAAYNGIKVPELPDVPLGEDKNPPVPFTEEKLNEIKAFIEQQPRIDMSVVYNMDDYNDFTDRGMGIQRYVHNSVPGRDEKGNIVPKPDIMIGGYTGKLKTDLNGGRPEIAMQLLTGAVSARTRYVSKSNPSEYLTEQKFNECKSTTRLSVNFFEDHPERGISGKHEYYIVSVSGNKVVLADSHNSGAVHTVTVKEIEKWGINLTPTDLSQTKV